MKTTNWYKIDGELVHYVWGYLDGKPLSIREIYEFESKNFKVIYK